MTTTVSTDAVNRIGNHSVIFPQRPAVLSTFSVVGPKEGAGPLGNEFDTVMPDTFYGESSWEMTETKMLKESITHSISRSGLQDSDVDFLITGDLLSQCTSGSFAARDFPISHLGVYSACASFGEGLFLASMAIEGGFATYVAVGVSSHHDSVERNYRFPTELGVQRPPTAQWTATVAATALVGLVNDASDVGDGSRPIRITGATIGEVIEMGAKDPFDMGSAMAPAAAHTLVTHFNDFQRRPDDYDLIITGDLAEIGREIVKDMLEARGLAVTGRLDDCGLVLYDRVRQDVHAGGSGAGCSAGVFCAYIVKEMQAGKWKRVLFAPTGCLHSPTTYKQGEAIPAVCHALVLEIDD